MGLQRIIGLCFAAVCLATGGFFGIAGASQTGSPDNPERSVEAQTSTPTINELRPHLQGLGIEATKRWPDDYAWIWPAEGNTEEGYENGVVVAFSRNAEEHVSELAKDFPWPELLKAETVKYSTPELQALQDKLIAGRKQALDDRGALAEATRGRFDLDGDLKNGKVVVFMPEITPEIKETFWKEYGPDIRFVESGLARLAACTNRQRCGKALRAGIQARNQPANVKKCSTGFTVKIGSATRILSAAHCSPATNWGWGNEKRYHGFTDPMQFGIVTNRHLGGGVDAEALSVMAPFVAHPWIYREDDDQQFPVKDVVPNSAVNVGDGVCRAGNTTGRRCGNVLGKMFTMERQGVTLVQLVRHSACSGGGDSGGPVFYGHKAYGIHGGYVPPNNNPGCGAGYNPTQSFYSPINWVLNQLGATMVFAP